MLDGSLVDYSDSDESERDPDLWIQTEDLVSVVVRRTTTKSGAIVESREILKQTSKKPSQEFYIPPGGRKSFTSMSPPSISPTSPNDSVFSGEYRDAKDRKETKKSKAQSPEKSDATISKSRRRSLPAVISTYLRSPVPEHISCIPLPEETTPVLKVPDKRSSSEGSKKSKHASLPVYVPPPQRLFTPPKSEIGGSGGMEKDRPAAESDFCTPKSRKTRHSDGDKPGSGVKRKCEDQIIVKAKKQECSSGSPPLSEKVGGHSQPKKVTLKPFWMACAPPARPMNSPLTVGELPGALRSDNLSTSPQPLSLPYTWTSPLSSNDLGDVNSGPSSLPNMSRRFCVPMGSTPDSDNRLCSVSGYSCSSADISPATSMSSLELAQEDSESTRGLNRRYSQGSAIPTISRSRISSLPPRLKRQIFEGTDPNNSRQLTSNQAVTSPTTSSYWKGNFWKRYCGFQKPFIDTHCHLDFLYKREGFVGTFQKYKEVHHETFPPNFEGCVSVFCEPHSFRPKSGLWKDLSAEPDVWIAMGCHPKCAEDYTSWTEEALATCLSHPKVIAAGEFGLDYSGRFSETADRQKDVFVRQLKISLALDKPLVIHCRRAEDDTFSIMEKYVPKNVRIHRHCFTEDFNEAKRWLDSFPNLYVGLTPLVTYKSAVQTHDVARKVPLDRLLLETDAPYFVPHSIPKSEMSLSHPGLAITVAEQVAYFRNIPVTQVIEATRDNTRKMYGI